MTVDHPNQQVGVRPPSAAPEGVSERPAPMGAERIVVAYVIHSMQVGGAERSIARLINVLDHQRFAPLVICLTHSGPAARWIRSPQVPVIEIHKSASNFDFKALRRLARVLREHRVDVIHSHNWGTLLETTVARRMARVPAHVHAERGSVLGVAEMAGLRTRLRGHVAGWAMRRCDAVLTNAHSVAARIEARCGYPAKDVRVIPNGVETPEPPSSAQWAAEQRLRLAIEPDAVVVGSVGRLVRVKGFELAVRAMAALAEHRGNFHLVLVGDGPELKPLASLAASSGVEHRVHFVGHQHDVGAWLALMDIYVNTSHSEGMSQSLVEALAAGRPVIATDVGDSAKVVGAEQECGYMIAAGDCQALCDRMVELAEPSTRRRMGRLGELRYATQFTSGQMSQRYQTLYDSLHNRTPQA